MAGQNPFVNYVTITAEMVGAGARKLAVKRDPTGTGQGVTLTTAPTDRILGFVHPSEGDADGVVADGDTVTIVVGGVVPAAVKDSETINPGDLIAASNVAGKIQAAVSTNVSSGISAGKVSGLGQVLPVDFAQGYEVLP